MLEIHDRAARLPSDPNIPWHALLTSRFIGTLPKGIFRPPTTLVVHTGQISVQDGTHAELTGVLEYAVNSALPIMGEFTGILHFDTRELSLREAAPPNSIPRSYTGFLSENCRVMSLRAALPQGRTSKPFHLVHEATLDDLTSE